MAGRATCGFRIAGFQAAVRPSFVILAILASLAALYPAHQDVAAQQPPAAQTTPQQNPQLPRFRAETNLVRVDAYVAAGDRSVGDLRADDFEVFEDGVRQKVETFEYVRNGQLVPGTGGVPADEQAPGRLFVLFIDTYHLPWVDREFLERREIDKRNLQPFYFPPVLPPPVPDDGMLRAAMREIVDRVVGENDRVAVLTPDMWAAEPSFLGKRAVIEELGTRPLDAYATGNRPPEWVRYEACFPNGPSIEPVMRLRFRLNRTFAALEELVANLELVRQERKAVILVTRGWDPPPRIHNYVDPRRGNWAEDETVCATERLALADKDFTSWFSRITDEANRANVAFYTMYAHPLVTYKLEGADIDEQTRRFERRWGNAQQQNAQMNARVPADFAAIDRQRYLWQAALTDLAKHTDGRAILEMKDFDKGLQEIVDDLSSYYLLGYYSSNPARDGKYRKISVTVKRKGVTVRARPGYRAVMPAELEMAAAANRPNPVAPEITAALAPLARLRSDVPFRMAGTAEWSREANGWRLRLIGEIDSRALRGAPWGGGAWRAEFAVTTSDGRSAGFAGVSVRSGDAAFAITFPSTGVLDAGDYTVRAKAYAADQETVVEDHVTVSVPATTAAEGDVATATPLVYRRANTARSSFKSTADARFTRREILMVEIPVAGRPEALELRIVDRQGVARDTGILPTVVERDGGRVVTAAVPLSSIAPGDYVLEFRLSASPERKVHVGFRVVP